MAPDGEDEDLPREGEEGLDPLCCHLDELHLGTWACKQVRNLNQGSDLWWLWTPRIQSHVQVLSGLCLKEMMRDPDLSSCAVHQEEPGGSSAVEQEEPEHTPDCCPAHLLSAHLA